MSDLRFSKPNGNWAFVDDENKHYGVMRPSSLSHRIMFSPSAVEFDSQQLRSIADKLDELNGVEKGEE